MIIAGLAGVAAPATLFAGPWTGKPGDALAAGLSASTSEGAERLVISGRILGADRKPLAGATIEAWHPDENGDRATVTTDADGRFFTSIAPARRSGRLRYLDYRVSHIAHGTLPTQRLHFTREPGASDGLVSHLQRDDTGVWRTTFGLTVA